MKTGPSPKKLQTETILDIEFLNADIRTATATDPNCRKFLDAGEPTDNPKWTWDINGHLCFKGKIFIPSLGDLYLKVLKAITNGHLLFVMGALIL